MSLAEFKALSQRFESQCASKSETKIVMAPTIKAQSVSESDPMGRLMVRKAWINFGKIPTISKMAKIQKMTYRGFLICCRGCRRQQRL